MDISTLQELHKQITELRKRANETDSKRETHEIELKIKDLELEFESALDNILDQFPDEIELRLRVNKIVKYDIWDFRSWIGDALLQRVSLEDLDIMKELRESINEDFDPTYEIDSDDVLVEFADDKYK